MDPDSSKLSFQPVGTPCAAELYPKKQIYKDDVELLTPFKLLSGEYVEFLGRTVDGVLALSNYRLFNQEENGYHNIPLGAVEVVECKDLITLLVFCKDGRFFRCTFLTGDICQDWLKRLTQATAASKQKENLFAFVFYCWATEESNEDALSHLSTKQFAPTFLDEVKRLKFNLETHWRISYVNAEFEVCSSYPPQLIVPANVDDDELKAIARFRVARRLPVVVWRYPENGAVIMRSSQPEVGLLNWRSEEDENYIRAVRDACAMDSPPHLQDPTRKVLIMDARSFSTALVNRARGGGVECHEYYQQCEIEFMNLPNIHTIRKCFQALRLLYGTCETTNWWQGVDSTRWLNNLAGILSAAVKAADAIKSARPVLVHCSDGWDRTPQIVSTVQILLDPYYRTVEGFRALVEREWLDFGHKFGDRCGNIVGSDDLNERCPVFLQWLDCVHQLLLQFPCQFQFSELFLVKLVQHTYSNLFGTFLPNSPQERAKMKIDEQTFSVWTLLQDEKYLNMLYEFSTEALVPSCDLKDLQLWNEVFLCELAQTPTFRQHLNDEDQSEKKLRLEKNSLPKLVLSRRKIMRLPSRGETETESSSSSDDLTLRAPNNSPTKNSSLTTPQPSSGDSQDGVAILTEDKYETGDNVSNKSSPRSLRLTPTRKHRTISEELYERFAAIDPPDAMTFSQESGCSSGSSGTLVNIPVPVKPPFDVDGLLTVMSPIQIQIRRIINQHLSRIQAVENQLQNTRIDVMRYYASDLSLSSDEFEVIPSDQDSNYNLRLSRTNHSGESSSPFGSFLEEHPNNRLLRPTTAHGAVPSCHGCNLAFWVGRRNYQCRKCNDIFCGDCCANAEKPSEEEVHYSVRICNACHHQLANSHQCSGCLNERQMCLCSNTHILEKPPEADTQPVLIRLCSVCQSALESCVCKPLDTDHLHVQSVEQVPENSEDRHNASPVEALGDFNMCSPLHPVPHDASNLTTNEKLNELGIENLNLPAGSDTCDGELIVNSSHSNELNNTQGFKLASDLQNGAFHKGDAISTKPNGSGPAVNE